jgi:predicted GNAT family acetyltransferase
MAHEYPWQLFQDQPEPKARQLNEAAETLSYCRRREALLRKATRYVAEDGPVISKAKTAEPEPSSSAGFTRQS